MQCDCEHETSGIVCGHRPGACRNPVIGKVRLHGLGMSVCAHCFEMQHASIPLTERLDFDWYIPVDNHSDIVKGIQEEQDRER